jgi:hypothetical protein
MRKDGVGQMTNVLGRSLGPRRLKFFCLLDMPFFCKKKLISIYDCYGKFISGYLNYRQYTANRFISLIMRPACLLAKKLPGIGKPLKR